MNDIQTIQSRIYEIRGQRVMLDRDLAELYQVTTGNLNKAVKRNIKRFPSDFMFQLTTEEWELLKFQIGILKNGRGQHTKYLPYAFTEQGLAMLSGILSTRTQLDAISEALAELQSKEAKKKPRRRIGFYTRLKNLTDYYGN